MIDKKEATTKIVNLIKQMRIILDEATKIADEAQISFYLDIGPSHLADRYEGRTLIKNDDEEYYEGGWQDSSAYC